MIARPPTTMPPTVDPGALLRKAKTNQIQNAFQNQRQPPRVGYLGPPTAQPPGGSIQPMPPVASGGPNLIPPVHPPINWGSIGPAPVQPPISDTTPPQFTLGPGPTHQPPIGTGGITPFPYQVFQNALRASGRDFGNPTVGMGGNWPAVAGGIRSVAEGGLPTDPGPPDPLPDIEPTPIPGNTDPPTPTPGTNTEPYTDPQGNVWNPGAHTFINPAGEPVGNGGWPWDGWPYTDPGHFDQLPQNYYDEGGSNDSAPWSNQPGGSNNSGGPVGVGHDSTPRESIAGKFLRFAPYVGPVASVYHGIADYMRRHGGGTIGGPAHAVRGTNPGPGRSTIGETPSERAFGDRNWNLAGGHNSQYNSPAGSSSFNYGTGQYERDRDPGVGFRGSPNQGAEQASRSRFHFGMHPAGDAGQRINHLTQEQQLRNQNVDPQTQAFLRAWAAAHTTTRQLYGG